MQTTRKPSPAFQFYPDRFMADTVGLTYAERGAYLGLVCALWRHRHLPSDPDRLRLIAAVPESDWPKVYNSIKGSLRHPTGDPTLVYLEWLEDIRTEQSEYRERQAEHGRKGGRPAHKRKRKGSLSDPVGLPSDPVGSPSPQPPPQVGKEKRTPTAVSMVALATRVREDEFIRGWMDLFAKHRGGEKYAHEGAKDRGIVRGILKMAADDVHEALRRAEAHLQDSYWAEHGANLGTFRSQWNRCVHGATNGNGSKLPNSMQAVKDYFASKPTIIDTEASR